MSVQLDLKKAALALVHLTPRLCGPGATVTSMYVSSPYMHVCTERDITQMHQSMFMHGDVLQQAMLVDLSTNDAYCRISQ